MKRRTLSGKMIDKPTREDPYRPPGMVERLAYERAARRAKREAEAAERGPAGDPQVACMTRGCARPWPDHLTKKKTIRAWARGHVSSEQAQKQALDRVLGRDGPYGLRVPTRNGRRRAASGSFNTHVAVKLADERMVRMSLDEARRMQEAAER